MRKLQLPHITERIYVFTPPVNGVMHVVDHDEVHRLSLADVPSVEALDDNPYEFSKKCGALFGTGGVEPLLSAGSSNVSYRFDPKADTQDVTLTQSTGTHHIQFPTLSGDWFVATLTNDAAYLLIAEPYLLEIYALK